MIRGVSFIKALACRTWLVLILLLLPVILIFLKIPAETLAGCSTYGYGCSQVACMGIEVSTDQGTTWRDGTVYIYGTPGSEKYLYVRTVLGVLSGQIQGWSFGVRHDATAVMLNGGQFSLNAATAGLISTVQCGSPPDFQDTRRRPCGYTQGVAIDTGSTGCKVSAPANIVSSYACYRVVLPTATGVYPVTLKLKDDVGDPPIRTIVTQNGLSKVPCKFDLTLNVYSTTSYTPTPSYCPLSTGTPLPCSQGQGGGVTVCTPDPQGDGVNAEIPVVLEGAEWKFFKGTVHPVNPDPMNDPKPISNEWTTLNFPDSAWSSGHSGFGYGDGDDNPQMAMQFADMQGSYRSVYTRHKFNGATLGLWRLNSLRLRLDFDDGIKVFINGVEARESNLPNTEILPHTALAESDHEASTTGGKLLFHEFDLLDTNPDHTPFALNVNEDNIIAVETHNVAIDDDDLTCIPEVIGFKRGPFLARGGPNETTIVFNTLDMRFGRVIFGLDPTLQGPVTVKPEEGGATREHEIVLTNLAEGTTFFYKAQAAPETAPNEFEDFEDDILCFTTPVRGTAHQFTFAAFGDSGADTTGDGANEDDMKQNLVAGRIPQLNPKPEFYLVAGDVIYTKGQRENFDARFFRYYADTLARSWFYQVLGDEDVKIGSENDPPFNFFGGSFARAFVLPEGNPLEPLERREFYYSFDWGPVHVVALNLSIAGKDYGRWVPGGPDGDDDDKGPMRAWATQDLANSTALWKVVFFHFPPYTYSSTGSGERGNPMGQDNDERIRKDFGPFFQNNKVDLVISGDQHCYERTFPLLFNAPDSDPPIQLPPDPGPPHTFTDPQAPIYIVTGGGGRKLVNVPGGGSQTFRAAQFSEHHLTTFSVEDHQIVIRAIKHDGGVADTATIVKTRLFRRGDATDDGAIDLSDAIGIFSHLFLAGAATCLDALDTDDTGLLDITDGIYLLQHLFLGGLPPPAPFPTCGLDLTGDNLSPCVRQPHCP